MYKQLIIIISLLYYYYLCYIILLYYYIILYYIIIYYIIFYIILYFILYYIIILYYILYYIIFYIMLYYICYIILFLIAYTHLFRPPPPRSSFYFEKFSNPLLLIKAPTYSRPQSISETIFITSCLSKPECHITFSGSCSGACLISYRHWNVPAP